MSKRKRPINGVQRRYSWRLYPTHAQAVQLREQARMCADLWNALLEMIETRYARAVTRSGKGYVYHCAACAEAAAISGKLRLCSRHRLPSEFDIGNWISAPGRREELAEGHLLRDCPEWRELSTWTPRRVATSLLAAYAAFFRRLRAGDLKPGYPRFKRRLGEEPAQEILDRRQISAERLFQLSGGEWKIPHRSVSGCRIWRGCAAWSNNRHPDNWSVALKGVDGLIRARGRLGREVTEWMDVDVIFRSGKWEMSAAVSVPAWRRGGNTAVTVQLDLVDGLARVNGGLETPDELLDVFALEERLDEMYSEHDQRWPRRQPVPEEDQAERDESRERLRRLEGRIARKRANALHVWSAGIVRRASALTIKLPPSIKDMTTSVRGQKKQYGPYGVEAATEINRVALSYAGSAAAAMLAYKAREAGIDVQIVEDEAAPIMEKHKILVAAERERSRIDKSAGSARKKKRRKTNDGGLDEHYLPRAVGGIS